MSVRSSLLAILTIGPVYGFQLHGELLARTAGRRSVNVGQVYSTLDRLIDQGAVESAGSTPDGLPLYRLTPDGRAEALDWLHSTASGAGAQWNDMLDRVLIASSLEQIDLPRILDGYRLAWQRRLQQADETGQSMEPGLGGQLGLSRAAERVEANAALDWLDSVAAQVHGSVTAGGQTGTFHRELSLVRPRRGRRPVAVTPVGAAEPAP